MTDNLNAEKVVLGCMIIDKPARNEAISMLTETEFSNNVHRIIFTAIKTVSEQNNGEVDTILVSEFLQSNRIISNAGGSNYLVDLINTVPTTQLIGNYIKIVKQRALMQELYNTSIKIKDMATPAKYEIEDADEIIEQAVKMVFEVETKKIMKSRPESIGAIIPRVYDAISEVCVDHNKRPGINTGYHDLDKITKGFQKSNLIIIAGRPGVGKTTVALNIAENIAMTIDKRILIFSLEMAKDELAIKLLSARTGIPSDSMRQGYIKREEWGSMVKAAEELHKKKIFIDDNASTTPIEMKAKARQLIQAEGPIDLILIDYLQLMSDSNKRKENRQQEVSDISRQMKIMAKELDVPVVVLSQLSRESEKRKGKGGDRPRLSDLRDSGAIEQDADLVIMLHNPKGHTIEAFEEWTTIIEILVEKNRHGKIGIAKLLFDKRRSRYENLQVEK